MKPDTVLIVLAGLGVGVHVILCLALLNPYVLFFGFLLIVPVCLWMLAMIPVVRSAAFAGLTMNRAVIGGLVFAVVMGGVPIIAAMIEGRMRAPPLPVPEAARLVRNQSFSGDVRVVYTVDETPGQARDRTAREAAATGWRPGMETGNRRFYEKAEAYMVVSVSGSGDDTVVVLFQRHVAVTPILLLLLTGAGYAGALFYGLTHPARLRR